MNIQKISEWNDDFFDEFVNYKNQIYKNTPLYITEKVSDLKKILDKNAPFQKFNKWQAYIIKNNDEIVGRVFCSTRIDENKQKDFLPFGYIEASNSESFKLLIEQVEIFAQEEGYSQIRGPIQGNVFNSSRYLIQGEKKRFLTEPIHKADYLDYLSQAGLVEFQSWYSWKSTIFSRFISLFELVTMGEGNKKRYKKKHKKSDLKIRDLNLKDWDNELKIFYELLMDSFSEMKDVEHITFEELKVYLDDLKHILRERDCLIIEAEGKPMGFVCALLDFQVEMSGLSHSDSIFYKLRFLIKKKLGLGNVLVLYMGKKKETEEIIKGIGVKLLNALARRNLGYIYNPVIFGYMQDGSKTSSLMVDSCKKIAKYATYSKDI